MIRVEGLTRSFGAVRAIDGVGFEAADGRITGKHPAARRTNHVRLAGEVRRSRTFIEQAGDPTVTPFRLARGTTYAVTVNTSGTWYCHTHENAGLARTVTVIP